MPSVAQLGPDAPEASAAPSNGVQENGDKVHEYRRQAQKLAHLRQSQDDETKHGSNLAAEAKFVTPFDPVVQTVEGKRLPAIPVEEATKLNELKDKAEGREPRSPPLITLSHYRSGLRDPVERTVSKDNREADKPLGEATAPSHTHPLFPPLPLYGPPSLLRSIQSRFFRATSAVLSLGFLLIIVTGAIVDAVPKTWRYLKKRVLLQDPVRERPFYEEEVQRRAERRAAEKAWTEQQRGTRTPQYEKGIPQDGEFVPTEGGPDPLVVDIAYYARRVGLDAQTYQVQTEDGFIIELQHIYNPRDYTPRPESERGARSPDLFQTKAGDPEYGRAQPWSSGKRKYPILMMHGLLQSAGAYCTTDDDSLAFFLAKSGYDVWLGNNRCGFNPQHTILEYGDPRMWAWNIRQMGVMDLPALISRVLAETGFPKLGLIAHSQGTTQTFVALAKEQRPDIGEKISLFCALAPAVYAGPLINTIYFRAIRLLSHSIFRLIFGIHAFIPLMMQAHKILPPSFYGWFGYHVFSFLFSWSDTRWERDFRLRMFQWAPVYVSAESMRWWLGRECFARHRCILATSQATSLEDAEDEQDTANNTPIDSLSRMPSFSRKPSLTRKPSTTLSTPNPTDPDTLDNLPDTTLRTLYPPPTTTHPTPRTTLTRNLASFHCADPTHLHHDTSRDSHAWYGPTFPPLALWIAAEDNLVDGRRLLRRFDRGREPHVRVVHRNLLAGYEHCDVIWAMDSIERVGKEVRELIWRTADKEEQRVCRVPVGCERPVEEVPDLRNEVVMVGSGGRARMASISENGGRPEVRVDAEGRVVVSGGEHLDGQGGRGGRSWRRRLSDALFVDVKEKGDPFLKT